MDLDDGFLDQQIKQSEEVQKEQQIQQQQQQNIEDNKNYQGPDYIEGDHIVKIQDLQIILDQKIRKLESEEVNLTTYNFGLKIISSRDLFKRIKGQEISYSGENSQKMKKDEMREKDSIYEDQLQC